MRSNTDLPRNEKFFHLVGDIRADFAELIRKEISLAKTEMGEKFRIIARNTAFMAAGGVVGLMAVFLLFLGLGAIIALALTGAGMAAGAAYFVAYGGLGLFLGVVAFLLVLKAKHAFQHFSLTPEKTMEVARGSDAHSQAGSQRIEIECPKPDSNELEGEVAIARARVEEEMTELKQRLTPGYLGRSTVAGIKHHPFRAMLLTAGAGLSGYFLWKQNHRNGAPSRFPAPQTRLKYWLARLKNATRKLQQPVPKRLSTRG